MSWDKVDAELARNDDGVNMMKDFYSYNNTGLMKVEIRVRAKVGVRVGVMDQRLDEDLEKIES